MNAMRLDEVMNASQALATAGDDPVVAEDLVKRFLAILATARADLKTAQVLQDEEQFRTRVHRLCSGGLYLGFEQVGMSARTLETCLSSPASLGKIAVALAELNEAIQVVLEIGESALLAWLKDEYLTH